MDNNIMPSVEAGATEVQQAKPEYTKYDTATAVLLFPVAYAFVRWSGAADYPLGRFLAFTLLFILSIIYMKKSGLKISKDRFSPVLGIGLLILNLGLIFTTNEAVQFAISGLTFLMYPYFVFTLFGNSHEGYPSDMFALEMLKALFVMPFGSISASFEAAMNSKSGKRIGRSLLMVIAGLAIAFIPTVFAFYMLSYDESFNAIIDKIFDISNFDIFSLIGDLIISVPLAVLIFGALYSGKNHRFSEILTAEKCKKTADALGFAPSVLCISAVTPLILIYSVFFVSQLDYYLSAFSGILPNGLTYAEYAKNGFFELCTVSGLNLFIMICLEVFSRKKDGRASLSLKIANGIFSVLTLLLIATAISKMAIYIGAYGLTVRRVLSSAFMIFLAVIFLALLIKQFASRTNVMLTAMVAAFLILCILAFSDVNGIIARYNTNRYLDGTLKHFEYGMLYDLGDSGVICLDKIARNSSDAGAREDTAKWLERIAGSEEDEYDSLFSVTIPKIYADAVLEKYK